MANEVIIEEYDLATVKTPNGQIAQIPGNLITTQVVTIGTLSAAISPTASFVRIQSKGTGFWYIFGDAAADATADTANNRWLPADQFRDLPLSQAARYIDTAASA